MDAQEMLQKRVDEMQPTAPDTLCDGYPYCCPAHAAHYAEWARSLTSFSVHTDLIRAYDQTLDLIVKAGCSQHYPELFPESLKSAIADSPPAASSQAALLAQVSGRA